MVAKLLRRKGMNGARGHTHAALLDGAPINVAHDGIRFFLFLRRSAEDNCARLMPWIAAIISHVIVENAMRPLRSAADAARHQTAMDVALGLPHRDRGEDFQIGLVQEVSRLL